jgi:hypothetical protein
MVKLQVRTLAELVSFAERVAAASATGQTDPASPSTTLARIAKARHDAGKLSNMDGITIGASAPAPRRGQARGHVFASSPCGDGSE